MTLIERAHYSIKSKIIYLLIKGLMKCTMILLSIHSAYAANSGNGTTDDLENMLSVMEQDVLRFAKYMETIILPEYKCRQNVMEDCMYGSYDGCASSLPTPSCPGGSDFASKACGDGTQCGALYDFRSSTLRIAPGSYLKSTLEPSDDSVKDAVCYSLQAEDYMINYYLQSKGFWGNYSVSPPSLYYGSDNGVFRIYPGNPKSCPTHYNEFDPRLRPWYVAASTGPKDVVLVLDTSGSMGSFNRINVMKDAAKYVINTLSLADYVSVVTFNTNAESLTNNRLVRVRTEAISMLISQINGLTEGGNTNFYDGFRIAFDTLRDSVQSEYSAGCQRAILFLTDGENNGIPGDQLLSYIKTETQYYTNSGRRPPVIFTYSFGTGADETLPKRIACETNGVWARISDGGNLAEAMTSYYKYFSFGLSDPINQDFTAWVEPYEFARGVGLGTSVSAPVFDRSVNPPTLAGVVAADISLAAMQIALGEQGEAGINTILARLVSRSVAYCPKFNLTQCQYQSLRYDSSAESLCDGQCYDITSLKLKVCTNQPYPSTVLNNRNLWTLSYEQRACCSVSANFINQGSADFCHAMTSNSNSILSFNVIIGIGVGVGGFVFVVILISIIVCYKKKTLNTPSSAPTATIVVEEATIVVEEATLVPVPLPSAPTEAEVIVEAAVSSAPPGVLKIRSI